MYLYFNSKGVLEEVVNDLPTRKDSSNVNHIYVYIDGVNYDTDDEYYPLPSTITALSTKYRLPDGTITPTALVNDKVRLSIPYDKHRDMKCFKDFTNYEFFDIALPSGVNEDGSESEIPNVLGQSGLVALTIITQPQSLALGLVVFNVEEEVGITTDNLITEAQFNYIINYITKYTAQIDTINSVIPVGTTPTNKLTNIDNVKDLIDANDDTDRQYVDSQVKVTPSTNVADKTIYTTQTSINGAYARYCGYYIDSYITHYIIMANNVFYDYNTSTKVLQNKGIAVIDSEVTDIANVESADRMFAYRAKLNGKYVIRAMYVYYNYTDDTIERGTPVTVDTNDTYGLYEPFILSIDNSTAYVLYSKENNLSNQDIVTRKITCDYDNKAITSVGDSFVVVSGTNQKNDNGAIVSNSRPGFSVVKKLIDGTYLMVFESNVNVDNEYPYVIQYMYFKDIEDKSTYSEIKTLFRVKNKIVNIPYLAFFNGGRIIITYHSTENYYGMEGDGLGIHKKEFEAVMSNKVVTYGLELTRNDFVNLTLYNNQRDFWSGGWGSVYYVDNNPLFLYTKGHNASSTSTQIGLTISTIDDFEKSSVEVANDTLAKRSSKGFLYASTATDLNPNTNPNIVVTKKYVGNYVDKKMTTVYRYSGTVETYEDLPNNASVGDTYNVVEAHDTYPAGTNYSWNGTAWDALGGSVDLSNYVSNDELTETLKNYQPAIGYGTNLYVRFLNVNKLASIYENGDADFQNVKVGNLLHLYTSGDVVFDTTTSTGGFHYYASSGALDLKGNLNINGGKIILWADSGSMDIQNINLKGYLRDGSNQTTVKEIVDNLNKYINITYSDLKALRDNSQLKKGFTYRITDFVTTTSQFDTQSANHPFDILVIADDVNVLNENAKAIKHSGDTYFANSKLESWELKYCIDNDTNRFVWASTNGKGVIYYMKDEFNNECPYDFKNIQFKRYKINKFTKLNVTFEELYGDDDYEIFNECLAPTQNMSGLEIDVNTFAWCYTFNNFENNDIQSPIDMSLFDRKATKDPQEDYAQYYYAFDNHISKLMVKQSIDENELLTSQQLNNIVFTIYDVDYDGWEFLYNIYGNIFETNCYNITFTKKSYCNTIKTNCYDIVGGNYCYSNTFGNDCYSNTFGNNCYSNTFGNNCYSNTFGNDCYSNTFGNDCGFNTFGNNCYSNTFGNDCYSNTFGNYCDFNTFGNNCYFNTFGNYCYSNTFGNNCYSNTLLDRASNNDNAQYAQYNIFENGVTYVQLTSSGTASGSNQLQNVTIHQGVKGTSNTNKKVVSVSRNVQHSIDVYAEGSETINV